MPDTEHGQTEHGQTDGFVAFGADQAAKAKREEPEATQPGWRGWLQRIRNRRRRTSTEDEYSVLWTKR